MFRELLINECNAAKGNTAIQQYNGMKFEFITGYLFAPDV
jgi:hypothetical protein